MGWPMIRPMTPSTIERPASLPSPKAVLELLKVNNIIPENAAVFGDDYPDMEMFEKIPCSIAMGNAVDALKGMAAYVTKTNDEGGIEYALEKILKIL